MARNDRDFHVQRRNLVHQAFVAWMAGEELTADQAEALHDARAELMLRLLAPAFATEEERIIELRRTPAA